MTENLNHFSVLCLVLKKTELEIQETSLNNREKLSNYQFTLLQVFIKLQNYHVVFSFRCIQNSLYFTLFFRLINIQDIYSVYSTVTHPISLRVCGFETLLSEGSVFSWQGH